MRSDHCATFTRGARCWPRASRPRGPWPSAARRSARPGDRGRQPLRPVQDGPPELLAPRLSARTVSPTRQGPGRDQGPGPALLGGVPRPHPAVTDAAETAEYKKQAEEAGVTVIGYGVVRFTQGPRRQPQGVRVRQGDGHRLPLGRPRPRQLRQPRQARRGVRHGHRHPQPRPRPPLGEDRHDRRGDQGPQPEDRLLRRHRPLPPLHARTPSAPSRSSARGSTASTSRTSRTPTTFTILGEGDLRTADLLKALAKLNYDTAWPSNTRRTRRTRSPTSGPASTATRKAVDTLNADA